MDPHRLCQKPTNGMEINSKEKGHGLIISKCSGAPSWKGEGDIDEKDVNPKKK